MTEPAPAFPGRSLPAAFDAATVADIDQRLAAVSAQHGARLLFAIESGSRAWGFPSPDSDYDCRFVYVRPVADYVRLKPPRDVIEFPIEGDLDVNGWDLRKALALAVAGNAVIVEWARAPIRYADPFGFQARLAASLDEIVHPVLAARHYGGLLRAHRSRLARTEPIPLKRIFYAIRPAAGLLWMRDRSHAALPPMDLPSLLAGIDVPSGARAVIDDLLARKAVTRELGEGHVPEPLWHLLDGAEKAVEDLRRMGRRADRREERSRGADTLLHETLGL